MSLRSQVTERTPFFVPPVPERLGNVDESQLSGQTVSCGYRLEEDTFERALGRKVPSTEIERYVFLCS
jgi:hypothetical protein